MTGFQFLSRAIPGKTLEAILTDRNNNFDIIRALAAALVMYYHGYLVQGDIAEDVVYRFLHPDSSGSLGVYSFFLISGLLIAKSAESRKSLSVFVTHRVLRIWPGLILYLAVGFCILIPIGSQLPASTVLTSRFTHDCVQSDIILVFGACVAVPDIYMHNPVKELFNGSLWTLQVEIYCYFVVFAYAVLSSCRLSNGIKQKVAYSMYVVAIATCFSYLVYNNPGDWRFQTPFTLKGGYSFYPVAFFLAGMLMYAFRESLRFDIRIAAVLIFAFLILPKSHLLFYLTVIYTVPAMAGWSGIKILRPPHDYSYGIYVYSFTIQQDVAFFMPGISGILNLLVSFPITLAFAAVSWHCVEKPFLFLGRRLSTRSRGVQPALHRPL